MKFAVFNWSVLELCVIEQALKRLLEASSLFHRYKSTPNEYFICCCTLFRGLTQLRVWLTASSSMPCKICSVGAWPVHSQSTLNHSWHGVCPLTQSTEQCQHNGIMACGNMHNWSACSDMMDDSLLRHSGNSILRPNARIQAAWESALTSCGNEKHEYNLGFQLVRCTTEKWDNN